MNPTVEAKAITYSLGNKEVLKNISFKVHTGESLAIVGTSGSGKSTLGEIISGHKSISTGSLDFNLPVDSKRIFIGQQHNFREHSVRSYYQQRYDSNYGEESPLVKEELKKAWNNTQPSTSFDSELQGISSLLKIEHIQESRLIELSNGEGKRVQLAKGLLQNPALMVFDNPFIGLDKISRKGLHEIINQLIDSGIIIFLITTSDEISDNISHVLKLDNGKVIFNDKKNLFKISDTTERRTEDNSIHIELLKDIVVDTENNFTTAVEMKNVSVSYGDKKVLDNINWKINKGDCWALVGANGSGKSTLLSLINGDNPKAYLNDIILFDHKKGEGESIWSIKRKIGYISPELHIYYQRSPSFTESLSINSPSASRSTNSFGPTVHETIASGFNDQVGASQKITSFQKSQVGLWLELLGLEKIKTERLASTSLGNQRLALLGRALVKNPPMLILDEPCQGLDKEQTLMFTNIVDLVCKEFNKTMIYVSHYSEDIPKCVTKQLVLEKGRVVV